MSIERLSEATSFTADDQLPFYSHENSDDRRASLDQFATFVATLLTAGTPPEANGGVLRFSDVLGTTFSGRVATAVAALQTLGGGELLFDVGSTYVADDVTTFPVGRIKYTFNCTIDVRNVPDASLFGVRFVPDLTDDHNANYKIQGLTIIAPEYQVGVAQASQRQLCGMYVGRGDVGFGNTAMVAWDGLVVEGGRIGIVGGQQTWLNTFISGRCSFQWYRGALIGYETTNQGEKMTFGSGFLFNGQFNEQLDAAPFEIAHNAQASVFIEASIDFANMIGIARCGSLFLANSHLENNSATPGQIYIEHTNGQEPPKVVISNCIRARPGSGLGPTTEPVGGVAYIIGISGGLAILEINGFILDLYINSWNLEVVKVLASRPTVSFRKISVNAQKNAAPYICKTINKIQGGGTFTGTAAVAKWKHRFTRNRVRNGGMVVTAGPLPDGWTLAGNASGLTLRWGVQTIDGVRSLVMHAYGTPVIDGSGTAQGTHGVYFESPTSIPAMLGETLYMGCAVRTLSNTGIVELRLTAVERSSGGSSLGNSFVTPPMLGSREWTEIFRPIDYSGTTYAHHSLQMVFTDGVPVDAVFVIDTPYMLPAGDPGLSNRDLIESREEPGTSVLTPFARFNPAGGIDGVGSLELRNPTGVGVSEVYVELSVEEGCKFLPRARAMLTGTGAFGLRAEWIDRAGTVITNALNTYFPGDLICSATFTGSISSNVLTVTAITGSLAPNVVLDTLGGVTAGTTITQQSTGSFGDVGTYIVSIPQTVASGSMSCTPRASIHGDSWPQCAEETLVPGGAEGVRLSVWSNNLAADGYGQISELFAW